MTAAAAQRKPCKWCRAMVTNRPKAVGRCLDANDEQETFEAVWFDADGFAYCAKFRPHLPEGEPPVVVKVTPAYEALASHSWRTTDA